MGEKVKLSEMSTLSVSQIIDTLSTCYIKLINNKVAMKDFPAVMLFGQPGAGKSQAVRQIGDNIQRETGKTVHCQDVRLLLFNPIDLRGIPVADEKKTKAIWLTPEIFQLDASDKVINILLLDEITAAPQSVQAAAYQLVLDRKVGEHSLPDNTIVIAAGNRVTDKSVAYKMPKALANRFLHFDVSTSFDTWKGWAFKHNINPLVMGFLSFRPDYLNTFDAAKDDLAFATPRSWEMVSNIMNNVSTDFKLIYHLICGLVGNGIAIEFKTWCTTYGKLPNIDDIFLGKPCIVPKEPSALFACVSAMVTHCEKYINDTDKIANSLSYAQAFPKDYAILLVEEYIDKNPEFARIIKNMPEFIRFIGNKATILNGQSKNGLFSK